MQNNREKQLAGHSGCEIKVVFQDGTYVVRKSSRQPGYNDRLYAQYLKQKNFESNIFLSVPVYSCGYDKDGLFFFTMKYINGKNMAELAETIELSKLRKFCGDCCSFLFEKGKDNEDASKIFNQKIESLEKKITDHYSLLSEAFAVLKSFDWTQIPQTPCHGDFTLENMLMSKDTVLLIDFLDSFYDSWLIDFAKLFQDIELHWHYRFCKHVSSNLNVRLLCMKEIMLDFLRNLPDGEKYCISLYYVLLLNVLRIIPYAKDPVTKQWISEKIPYVLKRIETIRGDYL